MVFLALVIEVHFLASIISAHVSLVDRVASSRRPVSSLVTLSLSELRF